MSWAQRLSTQMLWRIAAVLGLAGLAVTALTWRSSFDSLRDAMLTGLHESALGQARHDSDVFFGAQHNTGLLRQEWLNRLDQLGDSDPAAEIERRFVRDAAGRWRPRAAGTDDAQRLPQLLLRAGVVPDAAQRRQLLSAWDLLRDWGPLLTQRHHAVAIEIEGVALVTFSPLAGVDGPPAVRGPAPPAGNRWSHPYFDAQAGLWATSTAALVEHRGRPIGHTRQDLGLGALLARIKPDTPDGSYQLLLNERGEVLAHPSLPAGAVGDGAAPADPALPGILQALGPAGAPLLGWGTPAPVLQTADGQLYLAAATLQGPQWREVTVLPREVIVQAAWLAVRPMALATAAAALAMLVLLHRWLQHRVAQPLVRLDQALSGARAALDRGERPMPLPQAGLGPVPGELGQLAAGLEQLTQATASRDAQRRREAELLAREAAARAEREGLERSQRENLLRELSHTMQLSADATELGLWRWHPEADVLHFDAQMSRLHNLSPHACQIDLSVWMRLVIDAQPHPLAPLLEAAGSPSPGTLRLQLQVPAGPGSEGGQPRWLSLLARLQPAANGEPPRFSGVAQDITQRVLDEERIAHLATHDPLTGLANRARMQAVLSQLVSQAVPSALLFIDLDRFKHVNDSLGHGAGDELLVLMARLMSQCVRPGDLVSRLGGDEFVVLLPQSEDEAAAASVAQRMLQAMEQPVEVAGQPLRCTPSIGIALYPRDGHDAGTLLRAADIAMYEAKRLGRNQLAHFRPMMTRQAEAARGLETELRRGIERGEFELWLQPKVGLANGHRATGAEALLRWRKPGQGVVGPADFLPMAQQRGLMGELNQHVLETACRMLARWHAEGREPVPLAVNLSADHFAGMHLVSELAARLARHGVPARWLRFEITESTLLQDDPGVIERIHALRDMGVCIALDDFGTGYSSLSYLDRIPVDELKIDRSFVQGIRSEAGATPLVRAIVALGKGMGLTVVAEGVESALQADVLRELGCDQGQGYHFARPMPAADFERWIDRRAAVH